MTNDNIRFTPQLYRSFLGSSIFFGHLVWMLPIIIGWLMAGYLYPDSGFGTLLNILNLNLLYGVLLIEISTATLMMAKINPLTKLTGNLANSKEIESGLEARAYESIVNMPQTFIYTFVGNIFGVFLIYFPNITPENQVTVYIMFLSLMMCFYVIGYMVYHISITKYIQYFDYRLEVKGASAKYKMGFSIVIMTSSLMMLAASFFAEIPDFMNAIIFLFVVFLPLQLLLAWTSVQAFARPVSNILVQFKEIEGSQKLKQIHLPVLSTDEFGEVTHRFNILMNRSLKQIETNRTLAQMLAESAEELSSNAEQISASSENISSTQQQISRGASDQVIAITKTQTQISDLSNAIKLIRTKVEGINQISESVRQIASQTNMLALNAAIEAAKAGEAGRGFNVVAEQVRKLAEDSKKAVAKSDEMVKEIIVISQSQEMAANDIVRAVDSIATVAEETSTSTEEAAAAAEEQSSSMEQVTSTSQYLLGLAEKLVKSEQITE